MVAGFSDFALFLGFTREGLWRSAALHSGASVERIMEDWRREVDGALKQGLEESDDEFDQNLAQNVLEEMVWETCPAPKRPKIGGMLQHHQQTCSCAQAEIQTKKTNIKTPTTNLQLCAS